MAVYADVAAYKKALDENPIINRTTFLHFVKFARAKKLESPCNDHDTSLAVIFAQKYNLAESCLNCTCGAAFDLCCWGNGDRLRWKWRGARYSSGCDGCNGKVFALSTNRLFSGVDTKDWLNILDTLVMWSFEYTCSMTAGELAKKTEHVTKWVRTFQQAAASHMRGRIKLASMVTPIMKKPSTYVHYKRPAACTNQEEQGELRKRPATAKNLKRIKKKISKKRPAAPSSTRSTRPAARTKRNILQMDESFLNKSKPGKLTKAGRPKKDQLWIWGAVVQDRPDLFVFRVLEHPTDA